MIFPHYLMYTTRGTKKEQHVVNLYKYKTQISLWSSCFGGDKRLIEERKKKQNRSSELLCITAKSSMAHKPTDITAIRIGLIVHFVLSPLLSIHFVGFSSLDMFWNPNVPRLLNFLTIRQFKREGMFWSRSISIKNEGKRKKKKRQRKQTNNNKVKPVYWTVTPFFLSLVMLRLWLGVFFLHLCDFIFIIVCLCALYTVRLHK